MKKFEKLIFNVNGKLNYLLHIKTLQQTLNNVLKVTKVKKKKLLKYSRANAKENLKILLEAYEQCYFWKMMKNESKHSDIKLAAADKTTI